jgi:hypothetical protein
MYSNGALALLEVIGHISEKPKPGENFNQQSHFPYTDQNGADLNSPA